MTVNEFVRRIQTKASMLSTGDIPVKFNSKDIECVIELIENGKGYYINVKQPTKDLALSWQDIAHLNAMVGMLTKQGFKGNVFEEVLRRFNEQRKK